MKFIAKIVDTEHNIELNNNQENGTVFVNGQLKHAKLHRISSQNFFSLVVDNRSYQLFISSQKDGYVVSLNGNKFYVDLKDEKSYKLKSLLRKHERPQGQVIMKAPMPGLIVKINVEERQKIDVGDSLIIIEAMKMENDIRADSAGIINKIFVNEKDSVEKDTKLMTIESQRLT